MQTLGRAAVLMMLLVASSELAHAAPAAQTAVVNRSSETASPEVQTALLAGVRAFRAERYAEALQLFRQVSAAFAVQDIGLYEGMTLHKLGRHQQALVAFRRAQRFGFRDTVATYYQSVSCYRLGMLARARLLFGSLRAGQSGIQAEVLGPRLVTGALQFSNAIDQTGQTPEQLSTRLEIALQRIDASLQQSMTQEGESSAESRADLATEWLEEATELLLMLPESQKALWLPRLKTSFVAVRAAAIPTTTTSNDTATVSEKNSSAEVERLWCRVINKPGCAL